MARPSETQRRCLVRITPEGLPRLLGWIVLALVLTHIALQTFHYRIHELPWLLTDLFDVDEEESFPTWLSAMLLLVSSVLLFAIARGDRAREGRFIWHWYALALGFAVLSVDEVVGLHETLNTATDFPWTIPGAILVLVVAPFYLRFVISLPPRTRWLFVLAGVSFVGGSIVVEHLADYYIEAFEMDNLGYQFLTAAEEALEMIGIVVFIHALLGYLTRDARSVVPLLGVVAQEPGAGAQFQEEGAPFDVRPDASGVPFPGYSEGP